MAIEHVSKVPEIEPVSGFHGRMIHGDHMTLAEWVIDPESEIPEHHHPQEQIAYILEGEFALTIAGDTRVLGPGSVAVIPGNAPHAGRAITACRIVDVWHPVREDKALR